MITKLHDSSACQARESVYLTPRKHLLPENRLSSNSSYRDATSVDRRLTADADPKPHVCPSRVSPLGH